VRCRPYPPLPTRLPSRDRDIGGCVPQPLAGSPPRGEDSSPSIKTKLEETMQSKAEIDQILRQKCETKEIPGVVAMAATGNEVIYQGAFGKRDLPTDDPMTAHSA